jgi:hypothetical protein
MSWQHGVAWFDLSVDKTEHCYGWHLCCFEYPHEGDHMCVDGHFCPQESRHAQEDKETAGD